MYNKQNIIDLLLNLQINYEIVEHPAIYTIEEMLKLKLLNSDSIAKNLFLRDDKKQQYFLLTLKEEKRVNLKSLRKQLNSRPLTFASERDLASLMSLTKGAVTPFGLLNDQDNKIIFLLDQEFRNSTIGVHPNDNTATVWLLTKDLIKIIKEHGNTIKLIDFPSI